ncbi:hypothetical protein O7627_24300 [Solwaraspora sp. WMMD1047]|uniref:hypothetical protein n=1 Tax=Solwaraspora sp. WMMD1047 TaxID=3016102 RepID=UPI0024165B0C|nr:hypothetical protein [Solwaraspora sp. WMMD1047]MDG4832405.1 hypothetical protein [Solwaraspora sp. WMMD1047]
MTDQTATTEPTRLLLEVTWNGTYYQPTERTDLLKDWITSALDDRNDSPAVTFPDQATHISTVRTAIIAAAEQRAHAITRDATTERDLYGQRVDQLLTERANLRTAIRTLATALDQLCARTHRDLHPDSHSSHLDPTALPQSVRDALTALDRYAEEQGEALDHPAVKAALNATDSTTPATQDAHCTHCGCYQGGGLCTQPGRTDSGCPHCGACQDCTTLAADIRTSKAQEEPTAAAHICVDQCRPNAHIAFEGRRQATAAATPVPGSRAQGQAERDVLDLARQWRRYWPGGGLDHAAAAGQLASAVDRLDADEPQEPTDTAETPDAAARRFAGELERLRTGLLDRSIQPDPWALIGTGPVDTALEAIDRVLALVQGAAEWRGRYVEAGSPDWPLHGPLAQAVDVLLHAWPGVDLSVPAVTIADTAAEAGPDLSDVLRDRLAQADTAPAAETFDPDRLITTARHDLDTATGDAERAEAIETLLDRWDAAWTATAVTSPTYPLAGALVRLLRPAPSQGQDIPNDQLDALVAGLPKPTIRQSPFELDIIRSAAKQGYRVGFAAAVGCTITIGDLGDRLEIGDRPEVTR